MCNIVVVAMQRSFQQVKQCYFMQRIRSGELGEELAQSMNDWPVCESVIPNPPCTMSHGAFSLSC